MKEEIKSIVNHSLAYAAEILGQTGELHPFGAFTDNSGQVHPLEMEIDTKNIPNNGKIIETLWNYCMGELEKGEISAFGICIDSAIQAEEGQKAIDAIVVLPMHKDDDKLPAYCTQYQIKGEEDVELGELFAVDRKYFN